MQEWLWIILVGGIVMGLIGVVYNSVVGRLGKLESWKESNPSTREILTLSKHYELCKGNTKELKEFIKEELIEIKNGVRRLNGGVK